MVGYKKTDAYKDYASMDIIQATELLPPLELEDGEVCLAPGELMCRHRNDNGELCTPYVKHTSHRGLARHYSEIHQYDVARNVALGNTTVGSNQAAEWYKELMEGGEPSWLEKEEYAIQICELAREKARHSRPTKAAKAARAAQAAQATVQSITIDIAQQAGSNPK